MSPRKAIVAPSILASDFSQMGPEAKRACEAGAEWLHLDIMDGHFVPNISFGPDFVKALKPWAGAMLLDVHLMIQRPDQYARHFIESGAQMLTVHLEASHDIRSTLKFIQSHGCRAGLAINPKTPIEPALEYFDEIDLLLCMTVQPGFGGQAFIREVLPKIEKARAYADRSKPELLIEVDGGITSDTAKDCYGAGADVFVAGSYLFKMKNMADGVHAIRSVAGPL